MTTPKRGRADVDPQRRLAASPFPTDTGAASAETRRLMDIDYSIHFHVWTHETMLETLLQLKSRLPAFETEVAVKGHKESIFVLRRT